MTATTEKPKRRWKVTKQDLVDRITELEQQVATLTDERDRALDQRGLRAFIPRRKKA